MAPSFDLPMTMCRAGRKVWERDQAEDNNDMCFLVHLSPSEREQSFLDNSALHTGTHKSGLGHAVIPDNTWQRKWELSWSRVLVPSSMAATSHMT